MKRSSWHYKQGFITVTQWWLRTRLLTFQTLGHSYDTSKCGLFDQLSDWIWGQTHLSSLKQTRHDHSIPCLNELLVKAVGLPTAWCAWCNFTFAPMGHEPFITCHFSAEIQQNTAEFFRLRLFFSFFFSFDVFRCRPTKQLTPWIEVLP